MLKDMKSHTHLKPGQRGTKLLTEKYGDALLCVRYRTDEKRGVRLKTVELIVEEKPLRSTGCNYKEEKSVSLTIAFGETALRDRLKSLGGRWNPTEKIWHVAYGAIRGIPELEERILHRKESQLA